jgi:hypothetical protein
MYSQLRLIVWGIFLSLSVVSLKHRKSQLSVLINMNKYKLLIRTHDLLIQRQLRWPQCISKKQMWNTFAISDTLDNLDNNIYDNFWGTKCCIRVCTYFESKSQPFLPIILSQTLTKLQYRTQDLGSGSYATLPSRRSTATSGLGLKSSDPIYYGPHSLSRTLSTSAYHRDQVLHHPREESMLRFLKNNFAEFFFEKWAILTLHKYCYFCQKFNITFGFRKIAIFCCQIVENLRA